MAVAGLHNVSAFGPFFSESQCWDSERNRPSPRSSSVLQMCRELEGEHVISPSHRLRQQRNASNPESVSIEQESDNNGCSNISEDANDTEANHVVTSSEMEHDDNNNVLSESEQSSDLGESGRERVRQIFREWRNNGALAHSSNGLNNRSGPQWLGENECERVRVIREWVQMSAEHKSNSDPRSPRSEVSETDSQIELVRDGLAINNHQENGVRRPFRKLCGRQTLIDLLMRAQCERKGELWLLSERKPVSEFSHRNRIQALLRGRFLRNERLIEDNRHSSVAATELDFLRHRQTVSDLREEFLAKLENTSSASSNNAESDSSSSHENNNMPVCTERNIDSENNTSPDSVQVERDRTQHDDPVLSVTQENEQEANFVHSIDHQVVEVEDQSHQNEAIELEFSLPHERVDQVSINVESVSSRDEQVSDNEASDQGQSIHIEHADYGNRQHTNSDIMNASSLQTDNSIELPERSFDSQDITNQESDQQGTSSQLLVFQDSEIETRDSSWQQQTTFFSTEWTDRGREESEEERDFTRNWHETFANQWFQETSETNIASLNHDNDDEDRAQEPHEDDWPSHDLQEAIDSWLHRPSSVDIGVSLGRFHYDYFPDDENAQSMEISELSSRRRVSSLLRSSFRDSLNQVLQSHMERQVQSSSIDSEGESSSSRVLIGQHEEQLNVDQSLTTTLSDDVEANQFDPTLTNVTESNPLWDDESTRNSLLHANLNQLLGTEWEVINELRIDMARLQQRMNTMQSMLEACIDMQIELQRCVRQEVSAALNRTVLTRDKASDNESQWEHVRKGVCCLCGESKINSLLYRCGHMCTCCECAMKLVRDNGTCPMCRAPIVEAVRAYFIQ